MLYRSLLLACCLAAAASFASTENSSEKPAAKDGYFQFGTDFNFGFNGGPTDPMFAVDTAERYGGPKSNWRGLRIPLENARSYEEHIEPFFKLAFRAGYKDFHFSASNQASAQSPWSQSLLSPINTRKLMERAPLIFNLKRSLSVV